MVLKYTLHNLVLLCFARLGVSLLSLYWLMFDPVFPNTLTLFFRQHPAVSVCVCQLESEPASQQPQLGEAAGRDCAVRLLLAKRGGCAV